MEISVRLPRARLWLLVLALAWPLFVSPSNATASTDHRNNTAATVRIPGHVLPALSKATALSATDHAAASGARRPLTITMVLKRDHQAEFDRYLHELYDPHSKNFHRFLNQREIADRFGPSRQTYNSVLGYLHGKGFHLLEGSQNRLTLTMRGTREQAEGAFDLNIGDYQVGKARFFANDQDPAIPRQIASSVGSVIGLSNLAELGLRHGHMMEGINGLKGCYAANSTADPNSPSGVLATACGVAYVYAALLYDLGCLDQQAVTAGYEPCNRISILPLFTAPAEGASAKAPTHLSEGSNASTSLPGTGQTIGLVEFDSYNQSDVSDFLALVSAQAQISQLNEVKIDGGASIGSGESEVLLDIDTVMMLAPGANVSVYSAPFTGSGASFQTVLNKMIEDKVTVISNSWAYCEDETTSSDVNSIDMIFQNAAAAGISAFNGSGDSGSTCLDGSANTVAVPADAPHATAVGGSSVVVGPAGEYEGETWWNGSSSTPQTGQGGFGVSKFFTAPGYQTGLSTMRSVPDVVANADPAANGVAICEADKGGCPTNLLFGGTSIAAPIWAAFTAALNQAQGSNLGQINLSLYPLAGTNAFHTAASMGSDFAHVGLGSPNISALSLELQSATVGAVSASMSQASTSSFDVPDDGTSKGYVAVQLRDANGNVVSGKTVTLAANGGSHAEITPGSGVTSISNGAVIFSVTDLDAETVNFTANDTTDGVTLTPTGSPSLTFATAPSTQAAIGAFPTTVTADGAHPTTITVTLEDTLGRPSPGKEIQIAQTGNSVITGPIPQITDATGKIEFTGYDTDNETVTYTATDVTDGSLAFPETMQVTFNSGPEPGCGNGNTMAAPGYLVTPYVTGLFSENFSFAGGDFGGCPGAWGLAFDASGNLYVGEEFNGAIYKIPPGGGAASASNLIGTIGPLLGQLVFDNGNLYGVRGSTGGNLGTGAVLQIDPTSGAVLNTVVGNLNCPLEMAVDPLSGDLFVDDGCEGPNGSGALLRISHLATTPTPSTYATLPNQGNYQITFAADGTIYVFGNAGDGQIIEVGGTAGTQPAPVNVLSGPVPAGEFLAASGTATGGGAKFLIFGTAIGTLSEAVATLDLTTSPPSTGSILVNSGIVPAAENATIRSRRMPIPRQWQRGVARQQTRRHLQFYQPLGAIARADSDDCLAQPCAGQRANAEHQHPLCSGGRRNAGPVQRLWCESTDRQCEHQRQRTGIVHLHRGA